MRTAPRRPGHRRGLRLLPAARPAPRPRGAGPPAAAASSSSTTPSPPASSGPGRRRVGPRARRWGHRRMARSRAEPVTVASLAKGLSAPLAIVSGPAERVARVRREGPTRVHAGPPTTADVAALRSALDDGSLDVRRSPPGPARGPGPRRTLEDLELCPLGIPFPLLATEGGRGDPLELRRALTGAGVRSLATTGRCTDRPTLSICLRADHARSGDRPARAGAAGGRVAGGQHERTVGHRRPRPHRDGRRAARSVGHRGLAAAVPEPGPAGRHPRCGDHGAAHLGLPARQRRDRPHHRDPPGLPRLPASSTPRTESGRIAERVARACSRASAASRCTPTTPAITREVAEAARQLAACRCSTTPPATPPRSRWSPAPTPTSPGWSRTCPPSPTTGRRSAPSSTSWSGCPTCSPTPRGCATTTCSRTPCVGPVRARCSSAATARSCTPASSWPRRSALPGRRRRPARRARRQRAASHRIRAAAVPGPSTEPRGSSAGRAMSVVAPAAAHVREAVARLAPALVALSHDLHAHPEPAWAEHRSSRRLAEFLARAGLDVDLPAHGLPTAFRARGGTSGTAGGAVLRVRRPPGARPRVRAQRGGRRRGRSSSGAGATVRRRRGSGRGARHPRRRGWRRQDRAAPAARVRRRVSGAPRAPRAPRPGPRVVPRRRLVQGPLPRSRGPCRDGARPRPQRPRRRGARLPGHRRRAIRHGPTDQVTAVLVRGGTAPNVVPEVAELRVMARATTTPGLDRLAERRRAKRSCGCPCATGCIVRVVPRGPVYRELRTDPSAGGRRWSDTCASLGRSPRPADPRRPRNVRAAPTSGNVSHVVPVAHPKLAIGDVAPHSRAFAQAARSAAGDRAVLDGAALLALTVLDVWAAGQPKGEPS